MNNKDNKYSRFALCREMLKTPQVMRAFNPDLVTPLVRCLEGAEKLLLTGEGSSRIFPAKRTRGEVLRGSGGRIPITEGATQAGEYDLSSYGVLGASNSGRTRELVRLFQSLKEKSHTRLCGVSAHGDTPLQEVSDCYLKLSCGPEDAVAATMSVVEQAMVVQAAVAALAGRPFPAILEGADAVEAALSVPVPADIPRSMANARTIFFAGRNDGVAEELTLKTNEIVRKPSDYLEGTYAAHGIEEIMSSKDVVILVDPFPDEEAKLADCLQKGVGVKLFAISHRTTMFPTLKIPAGGPWKEYVLLTAGWNLLVEAGLAAGINLDKPQRARKVGNEV